MAISINLLAFYQALFECSCNAIHGQIIHKPFRCGLGQAIQWFNILQVEVEHQTEVKIEIAQEQVYEAQRVPLTDNHSISPLHSLQGRCASILMQCCPACGNIHVAMDSNFHHQHRRSAGDCPCFYDPSYFLPKTQVDEVGCCILSLCKCPSKKHTSSVPDEAIDKCEHSYEAADGKKQKAVMDSFNDTGVMALICWHDIPLFFANIDSPSEQQKYAVALLEHFFLIPQEANVVAFYDVGCILSYVANYDNYDDILPSLWVCQLEYNPQMYTGLGLSDSEDLGDWIKYCLKRGVNNQGSAAKEALRNCGITTKDLQAQWADQKKSQLSIHACTSV
ncbi:hypothetical protein BDR07DRAFT_1447882 [Suillus spraguei]|nr:hypothetical protein BDR07DRAFT_1447882 [Suillus spraguei]